MLREHREKAARERYAECVRARERATAEMQTALDALTGNWRILSARLAAGLSGTDLTRAQAWCHVLEARVRERATALQQAREAVTAVGEAMTVASRDREGMDKLFAKQRGAHDRTRLSEQQKQLDELAIRLGQMAVPGREPLSVLAK